jgi:hypothetical protein
MSNRLLVACAGLSLAALLLAAPRAGRADDAPAAKEKEKPPETVAAERGLFAVVVEASGVFTPLGAAEVTVEPEAYGGELKVVEAFRAPGPVEAGQQLLRLDTEKYEEQVAVASRDAEIAAAALAARREDAKRAEETSAAALAKAEQEKATADSRLRTFLDTEKDLRVRESEHRLQGTKDGISDQEEELAQLKKMYKSDDVVEETEEIVMKRAERALARTKVLLGFQTLRYRLLVDVELPREQRDLELAVRKEALELDHLRSTAGYALEQGRLGLAKDQAALERQNVALARLRADRERFVVRAPHSGLAIVGAFARGKWAAAEEAKRGEDLARALAPGRSVPAKQVLWTIVRPGSVEFRTTVNEATVLSVRPGQPAELTCGALGDAALSGRVERVSPTGTDGYHEVFLSLEKGDGRLLPGFSGKAKVKTAEKPDAVTVPSGSVSAEGDTKRVHVVDAEGHASPRDVKVGATSAGRTEILSGLEAGERVLKTPPKP